MNCSTPVVSENAVARNSHLNPYSRIKSCAEIIDSELGEYSYISQNSIVNKSVIGKFCSIGPGCFIGLWEHNTDVSTHSFYLYETSGGFVKGYRNYKKDVITTTLGSDVWVGANAVILKGIKIGHGSIVAASSVVTKDVPEYAVVAGNPARIIKYRFSESEIKFMLNTEWWDFRREVIQEMVDNNCFNSYQEFKKYIERYNERK
jgi:chloramphenicol O-acetyltransferase type B